MSFDQQCRPWSSEDLIALNHLRNEFKPKKTYAELEQRFSRTNEDIVNALCTIRMRKEAGSDPFEQIGSDKDLEKTRDFEKRLAKRRARRALGNPRKKEKEEIIIVSEYHSS